MKSEIQTSHRAFRGFSSSLVKQNLFKADKKLGVNKAVNLEMKISQGKATEWGLIKNQQTDLSPSNKINVTSTKDPVRTPPK
ncbi:unnamed protein product, partial [Pocillopora meandrina]